MPDDSQPCASSVGAAAEMPISKYERLIAAAKSVPSAKAVVAHPCDETSLRGAAEAAQAGLINPVLVGPEAKICRPSPTSRRSTSQSSNSLMQLTAMQPRHRQLS